MTVDLPDNTEDLIKILSAPVEKLPGAVAKKPSTAAIITAGGSGERFGQPGGKQLITIAGKPILTWVIETFDATPEIGLIVIVAPPNRKEEYESLAVTPYDFVTPISWAEAGEVRQESAFRGLEKVPDDYEFVCIHDGVRPIITSETIMHAINALRGNLDCDGAVVAHPSVDTLKVVEDHIIVGTPDRHVFWNAQTPQVFRTGVYRRAHASAFSDGFVGTDDASLIERLGGIVRVVEGKRDNIKLTVPEDFMALSTAVRVLRAQQVKKIKELQKG